MTNVLTRTPRWLLAVVAIVLVVAVVSIVLVVLNINSIVNGVITALDFVFNPGKYIDQTKIVECSTNSTCSVTHAIVYSALFLFVIVTGFAYTTLLERKYISWFQHRVGPNRVGPWGLLQPAADGLKLIFKEDITPSGAFPFVYLISPLLKALPTLIVLAVVPLGPKMLIPWFDGNWYRVALGLTDPNVGVLWILAVTSVATYGVVLAGWSSNNKYAMLGGLRASAQMISYELSLGLAIAVPVMIVGSMSVGDIINAQKNVWEWFVFQNPLAAGILIIALIAEVNRAPFDLPEAEQELTAGFMTEYSGMKFALFMMAEYLGMIGVSVIAMSMFFGGYHLAFVDEFPLLGPLVIIGKVVLCLIGFVWIRATLPRIRYDRLMYFGWKILLPLSLVAVLWTAVSLVIGDMLGTNFTIVYGILAGLVFIVVVVGGVMMLRRAGEADQPTGATADDPVITGERRGLADVGLQIIGGVLAVPFGLYSLLIGSLRVAQKMGQTPEETAATEAKAIQPAGSKAPAKHSGTD
jgi:NADH-quinone oxidoreductase subunit H